MADFQDVVDGSPLAPTDHQAHQADYHINQFLVHYHWLAEQSGEDMVWHKVFKHHMATHLAQNFNCMNGKFNWCFKLEEFVIKMSIIAHSVCFGVRSTALTQKLMEKHRLLMYIKFSRGHSED